MALSIWGLGCSCSVILSKSSRAFTLFDTLDQIYHKIKQPDAILGSTFFKWPVELVQSELATLQSGEGALSTSIGEHSAQAVWLQVFCLFILSNSMLSQLFTHCRRKMDIFLCYQWARRQNHSSKIEDDGRNSFWRGAGMAPCPVATATHTQA